MSNILGRLDDISPERRKRFHEAEKSLRRIFEEISPFIRPRESEVDSTEGEWCDASCLDIENPSNA